MSDLPQEDIDWINANVKEIEESKTPEAEFRFSEQTTEEMLQIYKAWLERVKKLVDIEFQETVKFADVDRKVMVGGKLHHYLECKIRRNPLDKYPTTKVPLRKHTFAEHQWNKDKTPTLFLAGFSDGKIAILNLVLEPDEETTMVARHDRGGDEDIYACYKIERLRLIYPIDN